MDSEPSITRPRPSRAWAVLAQAGGLAATLTLFITPASALMAQPKACASGDIQSEAKRDQPMSEQLAKAARSLPASTRAIVFGDSIAVRWPHDELSAVIGAAAVYLAHGGDKTENTSWIVDQVSADAAAAARKIVVSTGTHNLKVDDDCAFAAKARALMERLRRRFPAADIYLISLYPKGAFGNARRAQVLAANQILRQAAAVNGLHFVNVYDPIVRECNGRENCPLLEPNQVHPSLEGYAVISDALRAAMRK